MEYMEILKFFLNNGFAIGVALWFMLKGHRDSISMTENLIKMTTTFAEMTKTLEDNLRIAQDLYAKLNHQ